MFKTLMTQNLLGIGIDAPLIAKCANSPLMGFLASLLTLQSSAHPFLNTLEPEMGETCASRGNIT